MSDTKSKLGQTVWIDSSMRCDELNPNLSYYRCYPGEDQPTCGTEKFIHFTPTELRELLFKTFDAWQLYEGYPNDDFLPCTYYLKSLGMEG